jgi:hypothetical protein
MAASGGGTGSVASSPSPPWWAHVLIGALVIFAGVALILYHPDTMTETFGFTLVGSGVTFLGVGAGVAASS